MANWSEPKDNHQGGDEVTPEIFNNLAANEKYLKGEKDKHDTRLTNVEGRATDLEGRATSLEGRATELENRTAQAEKDIDAVEERATNLETRTSKAEEDIDKVEGRATSLENRSTSLEGRATNLEGRASSLEGRATKVEGRATALENKTEELERKKIETADVQNASVDITQATTRTNLGTKETIKSLFGKIKKWFADLRALAFKDKIVEGDIEGTIGTGKIRGLHKVATSGNYNELTNKPEISKEAIGLGNVENERQYSAQNPPPLPKAILDAGDTSKQIQAQYSGSWHGLTDGIAMWDGYKVVAVKYADLVEAIKKEIGGSTGVKREVLWTSTNPSTSVSVKSSQLVIGAIYEFCCKDRSREYVFYQKYIDRDRFVGLNACITGYMTDSYFNQYMLCPDAWSEGIEMYGMHYYCEADYPPDNTQQSYPCYKFSRIYI